MGLVVRTASMQPTSQQDPQQGGARTAGARSCLSTSARSPCLLASSLRVVGAVRVKLARCLLECGLLSSKDAWMLGALRMQERRQQTQLLALRIPKTKGWPWQGHAFAN